MNIKDYCSNILDSFASNDPWVTVTNLASIIESIIPTLGDDYTINEGVAAHVSAKIDPSAIIKAPAVIGPGCFIGASTLLRNGVYLSEGVSIGPGCEIKQSILGGHSTTAHFNFVGDSILGSNVNLEAGVVIANHFNEREDKTIHVTVEGADINTGVQKFGAVIGDNSKLGANSVTSPGTILERGSVVKRLQLIEQS